MTITPYVSSGTPSDSIGVQGDIAFDTSNRILWGPKGASSWSGTANNLVGPTGAPGASPVLPAMVNQASAWGPGAYFNGTTVGTGQTASTFIGTSIPHFFTPQVATALTGVTVSNYSASGATIYFYLYDLTAGAIVYNYNSGNGIANNTTASVTLGNTAYPLTVGHTSQWQAQRVTAAATTMTILPQYLVASGSPSSLSYFTPAVLATSTTVAKAAGVQLAPPGMPSQGIIYKNASPSYLYFLEAYLAGSGTADIYLYNQNTSANQFTQDNYGYTTLTSTLTRYTFGPFSPTTWPFTAANQYSINIYNQGTSSMTITQAVITLTVGQ